MFISENRELFMILDIFCIEKWFKITLILIKAPYIHLSIDSAVVTNNAKLSGFTRHMIILSVIYLRKMSIRFWLL